jgi:predicted Rossmann fold flavoprotein
LNKFDLIVVGAGPAGILAAGRAAEKSAKVLLFEKMPQAGRKLLITGKGRCNVTNDAEIGEFIKYVNPNGRFLRQAFSEYFSKDILHLLNRYGVEMSLERGGRYFPVSNQSSDILNALKKWLIDLNVDIVCKQKVEQLIVENKEIKGVVVNGKKHFSDRVILATGGKSYPATGSTGDGYRLSKDIGHSIVRDRPALVAVETAGEIAKKLQGLNLKNVKASVWVNDRKMDEDFGEMIFTHFGLSGPIILTLSRIMVDALYEKKKVVVSIDLKPALDEQKLDKRLLRDLNEHGKKKINNVFKYWLPSSMIEVFVALLGFNSEKECHQISSTERKKIRYLLKNFQFKVTNHRPYEEAIITAGGIPTNEINPKTMESKIIKGLYFAGELIDVDAKTGGYNLQIAYSTGWLAANSAVKDTI